MECKDFEPSIIQDKKVLKLCRRLKNCTLEDLVQFTETEKSVIETILLYLIDEEKIQEKDGIYSFVEQTTSKNYIENKNLNLMFMYHSPEKFILLANIKLYITI